ncbi:hypothetical protein GpartN1_g7504.t1 [Galdieria partita]|uniref:RNase NYN domain-containing protein n=1 Tax=Galdieria partita TaxID=83374 RepID=A0A9C7UUC1_9RHOD|nr:hypothetical protein GpartN1_g7504.t1 [Galdieria partita]
MNENPNNELEEATTVQLFSLLAEGLCPFVFDKLRSSLGNDNWQLFVSSPPPWSIEYSLKVILDRWFAIFSDSCLANIMLTSLGKGKEVFSWIYARRMDFLRGKNLSSTQIQLLNQVVKEILIAIRSPFAGVLQTNSAQDFVVSGTENFREEEAMEVDKVMFPSESVGETAILGKEDIWLNWKTKPLIVLDGANIAWKHGKNQKFSPLGIVLAFEFFSQRQFDCVCFLPETYWQPLSTETSVWSHLITWRDNNRLILTPANDYDDSYILYYAQTHGGLIVSNDQFLDHIEQTSVDWHKRKWAKWLSRCRVTFVFGENEFIPNPSFHVTAACEYIDE